MCTECAARPTELVAATSHGWRLQRVKVSLFLQDGIQNMDGSMVQTKGGALPFGVGMPGSITYFDKTGAKIGTARVDLPNAHLFTVSDGDSPGLGCNIYARDRKPATTGTAATGSAGPAAASDSPVAKPGFQQQGPSPSKQAPPPPPPRTHTHIRTPRARAHTHHLPPRNACAHTLTRRATDALLRHDQTWRVSRRQSSTMLQHSARWPVLLQHSARWSGVDCVGGA